MERWWTFPAQAENGRTIMVTGRDGMSDIAASGKYIYRVDVSWDYDALPDGMPDDASAQILEEVTDALTATFKKDKVAYITGIYTGDGKRDWVFYVKNLKVFSFVFNKALESLPLLPLLIEASEDADWEEYNEMREATYIPKDEEE